MTPEEPGEARAKEVLREFDEAGVYFTFLEVATLAARLAREGWTPPEPVDPDILAFREWGAENAQALGAAEAYQKGLSDNTPYAKFYLAGARMAREQAKPLAQYLQDRADRDDAEADRILAKYQGEA